MLLSGLQVFTALIVLAPFKDPRGVLVKRRAKSIRESPRFMVRNLAADSDPSAEVNQRRGLLVMKIPMPGQGVQCRAGVEDKQPRLLSSGNH